MLYCHTFDDVIIILLFIILFFTCEYIFELILSRIIIDLVFNVLYFFTLELRISSAKKKNYTSY